MTGAVTRPVRDMEKKLAGAGFKTQRVRRGVFGTFVLLVARKK